MFLPKYLFACSLHVSFPFFLLLFCILLCVSTVLQLSLVSHAYFYGSSLKLLCILKGCNARLSLNSNIFLGY